MRECPFKHKKPSDLKVDVLTWENNLHPEEWFVTCECGARGPVKTTKQKAINAWDRGRNPDMSKQ